MDANELRSLQAPIKARYKDDPATARVTVEANGQFQSEPLTCTVENWVGPVVAGLHPATGGRRIVLVTGFERTPSAP